MARLLFTANSGGVSTGNFTSLNLASHVGDEEKAVLQNRRILEKLLSTSNLQFMNQVHGNEISIIQKSSDFPPRADALITSQKSVALVVLVADCLPVLIDGVSVVAAVHVGRRGMINTIIEKTVSKMREKGGTDLHAYIGPGICGECYEVDEEMYRDIVERYPNSNFGNRKIDIRAEVNYQLQNLDVVVSNLDSCTLESEEYFSFRRDNVTGRQCGAIVL